jgi:hypothetical protein
VVKRISGPEKQEETGKMRKLHKIQLHKLYCSPNIVKVLKSKRMRCLDNGIYMREIRNEQNIMVRKT